jgi:sensor histidine kinase YesM
MRSALKRLLRAYAWLCPVWTVLGIFFFSQGLVQKYFSHEPTPWWHYLLSWMTGMNLCALLTPAILWLGRRFPIERRNWLRRVALQLLFSVAFTVIELGLHSILATWMGLFPLVMRTVGVTFAFLMIISFHQNIITYWSILGIQYAVGYYRKYQEREKDALRLERDASELQAQLVRAQLSALKMQLQPHFLFNTLNAIMVLVRQQRSREAEETLGLLGDLLRCVLDDGEAQEVPLRRELEYLQLYLAIEQVRFQDRLRVEISADPAILDVAVPHMGLQPIVENAIRHGIGRKSSAGKIQIGVSRVNQSVEVTVRDDGPGLPPAEAPHNSGIGLANTRARLRQLYGDAGRLTVENGEQGGVVVTMVVPYRVAPGCTETELMATETPVPTLPNGRGSDVLAEPRPGHPLGPERLPLIQTGP